MTHSITAANEPSAIAPELTPRFDLDNPQHLAMRKLMAEIYCVHIDALSRGSFAAAERTRILAEGLEKAARLVLNDPDLSWLCFRLVWSLEGLEEVHRVRSAA